MRIFGHIPSIREGHAFENRQALSKARVHAPTQAGISGSQNEGADSIVLSGGYEDDIDLGDEIIYTGHGGRDLNTGRQIADQELTRQNLALAKNCILGLPVRVVRGFSHKSAFSPLAGYRYDGLFYVDSYWKEKGISGYGVWRFRLYKDPGNIIPTTEEHIANLGNQQPVRKKVAVHRIIRDNKVGLTVKALYDYKCQVCNTRIETSAGFYAETAHIKPLGIPHNGPDTLDNVLCLCPNHHVMFDFGGFVIADDFSFLGLDGKLTLHKKHKLKLEHIIYHREHFWK